MSCLPSYSYTPTTFTPGDTMCSMPSYNNHRSRLFINPSKGMYFRSKNQGPEWNAIVLSITIILGKHTLTVSCPGHTTEIFDLIQGSQPPPEEPPPGEDPPEEPPPEEPCTPGIAELRAMVNTHSALIEMYPRGDDIEFDAGGVDALCIITFPPTNMTGGEGGPTDGASVNSIRTGPSRSMIAIQTEEALDGTPIPPGPSKRVQQWNGTTWIGYSNDPMYTTPGGCPGIP